MDAQVTIQQLGGRMFTMMTGAKQFVFDSSNEVLRFRLPSNFAKSGINLVSIHLNGMDLYDVTFSKVRGMNVSEVAKVGDVYAEDLRGVFTEHTGLLTSM